MEREHPPDMGEGGDPVTDSPADWIIRAAVSETEARQRARELEARADSKLLLGVATLERMARWRVINEYCLPFPSLHALGLEQERLLYHLRNPLADGAALRALGRTEVEVEIELHPWRYFLQQHYRWRPEHLASLKEEGVEHTFDLPSGGIVPEDFLDFLETPEANLRPVPDAPVKRTIREVPCEDSPQSFDANRPNRKASIGLGRSVGSDFPQRYPQVYRRLLSEWGFVPDQPSMAKEFGVSVRTFQRALDLHDLPWPP